MLRIITGKAKGKKLETLLGDETRPTSERIKEAIFSSIQFDIENRRVLDLFAGCGQLGLEALSRGAVSVSFVDASRDAIDVVKRNAKATDFFEDCRYIVSDWRNYIRKAAGKDKYDLVFIDPPYSMQCCVDALLRLENAGLLATGAIVVLESGEENIDAASLTNYEVMKSTHYGKKTFVNVLLYKGGEE